MPIVCLYLLVTPWVDKVIASSYSSAVGRDITYMQGAHSEQSCFLSSAKCIP